MVGLDDHLADHAESPLETLEGRPEQFPGQIHRESEEMLMKLGRERFDFLMKQLDATLKTRIQDNDPENCWPSRSKSASWPNATASSIRRRAPTSSTPGRPSATRDWHQGCPHPNQRPLYQHDSDAVASKTCTTPCWSRFLAGATKWQGSRHSVATLQCDCEVAISRDLRP